MNSIHRLIVSFRSNENGASAVEFALIAPMLAAGFAVMTDIGMAINESMLIDNTLRAGAQSAMQDPGSDKVRRVMDVIHSRGASPSKVTAAFTANRYCLCPEDLDVPDATHDCGTACETDEDQQIFYELRATKVQSGILMTDFDLSSSIEVQVQ